MTRIEVQTTLVGQHGMPEVAELVVARPEVVVQPRVWPPLL